VRVRAGWTACRSWDPGRSGQRVVVRSARAEVETGFLVVEARSNGRRGGEELRWAGLVGEGALT
jgi:hypothetical protein